MNHLIKKQIMHIQTAAVEGTHTLQQEASRYFNDRVLPVLEKVFDMINEDEQVLSFDRIEIDLGVLRQNHNDQFISEEELYPLIQRQFEDYLRSKHHTGSLDQAVKSGSGGSKKQTASFHAFDQWLHYMQHGVLPWNRKFIDEKFHTQVLDVLSTDIAAVKDLTTHIQSERVILLRIVRLHEESFLVKLVESLTGEKQTILPELLLSVEELLKGGSNQRTKEELWQMIIQEAIRKGDLKNTQSLLTQLCRTILPLKNQTDQQLFAGSEKWPLLKGILQALTASSDHSSKQPFLPDLKKSSEMSIFENQQQEPKNNIPQETHSGSGFPGLQNKKDSGQSLGPEGTLPEKENKITSLSGTEEKTETVSNGSFNEKDRPAIDSQVTLTGRTGTDSFVNENSFQTSSNTILEEGLFVKNAGLVLLHPFFQFLFRNTGLSKGIHFTDKYTQQQAIYLLHYIATGEEKAEEHILVIPKLICGWPVTAPVLKDVALTGSLLMEADDLIRAAIAQWTILKSTSAEGLRESFLQREGKLFTKSDKLYIQLEKNSIDILLDHLPWNMSIIKFPWFKDILWVEWR